MIRKYIIEQYVNIGDHALIVGHHGSIHLRMMWRVVLLLLLLWGVSTLIFAGRGIHPINQRILSGLILFVYGYFVLQFLNDYLDALIGGKQGITLFRWDGLLQYSVQQFEWNKIEMISFVQHSLSDKMRNKGDIVIHLEHDISFRIEDIPRPKKISNMLWSLKGQHAQPVEQQSGEEQFDNNEKFEILVETLGEVIKDYMERGEKHPPKLS